jgi:4-alpha-glucanotransferase
VTATGEERACQQAARAVLGIRTVAFGIHDAAFPADDEEDVGRGSPYARGARRLLEWAAAIGFDAVQLGPQGATAAPDDSPYDAAIFARSPLSIAAARLAEERWSQLLDPGRVAALLAKRRAGSPGCTLPHEAARLQRLLLDEAWRSFRARRGEPSLAPLADSLASLERRHQPWLERDAFYEALCAEYCQRPWTSWDPLDAGLCNPDAARAARRRRSDLAEKHAATMERFRFEQVLAHAQHEELRGLAASLGLRLFADAQIGLAERDRWAHHAVLVPGYRMGAPPSRTNPEGQPWDYPVLDPGEPADSDGAVVRCARQLVGERMDMLFAEFDAVRLDHPHGYVCPWVYRAEGTDRGAVLRAGARLRASPDLPDHPELARFAIAEPRQLDRSADRWADDWVTGLRPEQVERYAVLFDTIVAAARRGGRGADAILCEVLSTEPLPLRLVRERYGLGRFRVTQKAALSDPDDVYRIESARPEDWVMVGTHDTDPIWALAEDWVRGGRAAEEAEHLAARLEPERARRARMRDRLARHPGLLAQAKLAELLLGPARQVMVYFTDALGLRDPYNVPGSGSATNWSLRLPSDWLAGWRARLAAERALDLPLAFALALRARGGDAGLVARLAAHAARLRGAEPALLADTRL